VPPLWNRGTINSVTVRLGQQASRGFRPTEWAEIRRFLGGMAERDHRFAYLVEIVESVMVSGLDGNLAATTSMHDLIVAVLPLREPPFDVIAVRVPGSLREPPSGQVLIEHLTPTGHDDGITCPIAEAVPLFWRFVSEKFGLRPPER
jgi:hypothetical protein